MQEVLKSAVLGKSLGLWRASAGKSDEDGAFVGVSLPQLTSQLEATAIRHDKVEQHGMRAELLDQQKDFRGTFSQLHIDAFAPQKDAQRHHSIALVVRDQDPQRQVG